MDFPALLAFNPLAPIVTALHGVLTAINGVLHSYGWSLIALALLVKAVFWPLNTFQFKAMLKTQALAPQVKALQAKYKGDREKLNAETMRLYKETGANPLAGCLPLLLQMPILISLYQAINGDSKSLFAQSTWLWIGTEFSKHVPNGVLATNLAQPDYLLLALYVVSMYFSIRFTSPAMDEQQAQQQRIMSFVSPVMVGYIGFRYHWASALLLYWLSFNIFTMAQQFYLINKYHRNPAAIGPHPEKIAIPAPVADETVSPVRNGVAPNGALAGGSRNRRKRKSSRR